MTRSVIEVETGLPQGGARQRIKLRAGGAFGKPRGRNCDMTFEYPGKAILHFQRRSTDSDGARDVRRAI